MANDAQSLPLISVVITSYNYGNYLETAIRSVREQTYSHVEIIVVDDGSTDDTELVTRRYPTVQYCYQDNRGVSAARNTGIRLARGEYICFLDADDWLEKSALECGFRAITQSPALAFVSGNYYLIDACTGNRRPVKSELNGNPYAAMLRSNYIGMLAAVLFRTSVLLECGFSERTTTCEDYELFLRITRNYPVSHHPAFVASYFHHENSLSHHYPLMAENLKRVLEIQESLLRNDEERAAFREGVHQWKDYLC